MYTQKESTGEENSLVAFPESSFNEDQWDLQQKSFYLRINVIYFVFNANFFNLTPKSHSVHLYLLNKLLLVFCLPYCYYH